jgi:hypothetical protein
MLAVAVQRLRRWLAPEAEQMVPLVTALEPTARAGDVTDARSGGRDGTEEVVSVRVPGRGTSASDTGGGE